MDLNEILKYVSTIGFPIVVASYLLLYVTKEISDLNDAVTKLDTFIRIKLGGEK